MELTTQQIETLFAFTKKKLVHWYDLQIELVDHLALRIEEEMNADAKLDFDKALEKVYKGFGIFGFAKIVQEKEQQLQRASRKMWWTAVREFFRWPKIIHLVCIFGVLWMLSNVFDTEILAVIFMALYVTSSWILLGRLTRNQRKTKKSLMVLQFSPGYLSGTVLVYEMMLISWNNQWSPLVFTLLATLGILFKVVSFQLYFKVREDAMRMYPEAFA